MDPIQLTLRNNREKDFAIRFLDAKTPPVDVPIDGLPRVETTDPTVGVGVLSADGRTLTVRTTGVNSRPGEPCRISVIADAVIGDGVREITGAVDLTVVDALPDEAVDVELTPGEERDRGG